MYNGQYGQLSKILPPGQSFMLALWMAKQVQIVCMEVGAHAWVCRHR